MVVQSGKPFSVFGISKPNADVSVVLANESKSVQSNDLGRWKAVFPARKPSFEPIVLHVKSESNSITVKDILFGEVWLFAGQSNMEWPVSASSNGPAAIKDAKRSRIRVLNLVGGARGASGAYSAHQFEKLNEVDFMQGKWSLAEAESVGSFSAVGWYFGRSLEKKFFQSKAPKSPIGLINVSVGGTPTESWIDRGSLRLDPDLKSLVACDWLDNPLLGEFCRTRGRQNLLPGIQGGENVPSDECGPNHAFKPGFMWKSSIKPLLPFSIRGVVWYQGESNAESLERVKQHDQLFPLLVNDWRRQWKSPLPFFVVQLPAIGREFWPHFRESQRRTALQLDDVELVTTIQTGHPTNVHPPQKRIIGAHVAAIALGKVYGLHPDKNAYSKLKSLRRVGKKIELVFEPSKTNLHSKDRQPIRHFELAGHEGRYFAATAELIKNRIFVSSEHVAIPTHVRYAFSAFPNPPVNLFNESGFAISPFVEEVASEKPIRQ